MDSALILGIITLLTTIAGFIYTWFKDERDRKWRKEDEAAKSHHLSVQDKVLDTLDKKVDVVIKNGNGKNGHAPPEAK